MTHNFKVGDEIEAIDDYYGFTTKSKGWKGIVTHIHPKDSWYDGCIDAKTTEGRGSIIGEIYEELEPKHFTLQKTKTEQEATEL